MDNQGIPKSIDPPDWWEPRLAHFQAALEIWRRGKAYEFNKPSAEALRKATGDTETDEEFLGSIGVSGNTEKKGER